MGNQTSRGILELNEEEPKQFLSYDLGKKKLLSIEIPWLKCMPRSFTKHLGVYDHPVRREILRQSQGSN